MNKYKDGELVIIEVENLSELAGLDSYYDICLINNPDKNTLIYPTKITYEIELDGTMEDYLKTLNQKRRYNLLRQHKIIEEKIDTHIKEDINEEDFNNWNTGYKEFISELPHGDNRVDDSWFDSRGKLHLLVEYRDRLTNEIVGGTLVKKMKEKMSMSYGWANKEERRLGIATHEVFILLDYAISKGYKKLSFGQDNNLYGGHLSLGLHHFKTYWNTKPKITVSSEKKGIVFNINSDKSFCFYLLNEDNSLYLKKINYED